MKKTSGLKDNDLKWKIHNTNILRFDDRDITDDEVELEARRTGTTYVSCYNSKNKKTITYKINVIRDRMTMMMTTDTTGMMTTMMMTDTTGTMTTDFLQTVSAGKEAN